MSRTVSIVNAATGERVEVPVERAAEALIEEGFPREVAEALFGVEAEVEHRPCPVCFTFDAVREELANAVTQHPKPYASCHEGYGIIKEEFRELEEEIFRKNRDPAKVRKEAIQLATTAIRLVLDVVEPELIRKGWSTYPTPADSRAFDDGPDYSDPNLDARSYD